MLARAASVRSDPLVCPAVPWGWHCQASRPAAVCTCGGVWGCVGMGEASAVFRQGGRWAVGQLVCSCKGLSVGTASGMLSGDSKSLHVHTRRPSDSPKSDAVAALLSASRRHSCLSESTAATKWCCCCAHYCHGCCCLLLLLQTVEALLPSGAGDEVTAAAQQWGQAQGLSVRSAATFARSCRL